MIFIALLVLLTLYCLYTYYHYGAEVVETSSLPTEQKVIFIDAGHGGFDPGMVGTQGEHEKNINLAIAKYLQGYLENSGAFVLMTRIIDEGLYNETDSNKKRADLNKRKQMINESKADIMVSIHQNSFTQPKYKGAQVFYHESSPNGKLLAEIIQNELKEFIDPENKRVEKANESYYMLKETSMPSIIVECGFLSNPEEEIKLNDELYQQKMAWGIYMGIVKYFNQLDGINQIDDRQMDNALLEQ